MAELKVIEKGPNNIASGKIHGIFLVLSWLSGLLPIANPFLLLSIDAGLEEIRFGWCAPALLLPLGFFGYPVFIFWTTLNSIFSHPLARPTDASQYIQLHLNVTAGYTVAILIRIFTVIYCKRTMKLIRLLQILHTSSTNNSTKYSAKRTVYIVCLVGVGTMYLAAVVQNGLWTLGTMSLPGIKLYQKFLMILNQYAITCPAYYSAMFISFFGFQLISAHDLLYRNLVQTLNLYQRRRYLNSASDQDQRSHAHFTTPTSETKYKDWVANVASMKLHDEPEGQNTRAFSRVTHKFQDVGPKVENIFEDLVKMKKAFKFYSQIAGMYSFVLVFCGLALILKNTGLLLNPSKYTDDWKMMVEFFFGIFFIFVATCMGNWMEGQMEENREWVRVALGQLESGADEGLIALGDLFSKWDWSLNAAGLFKVNRQLIPGLIGVTMTYTIFMFQLKMSRDG